MTSSPSQSSFASTPGQIISVSEINAKFELAESTILNWEQREQNSSNHYSLFHGNRMEAYAYLGCVNDLQSTMHFFVRKNPASETLTRAQKLMQLAITRLSKEFHRILSSNQAYLDPEAISNRSSPVSPMSSASEVCSEDNTDSVSEMETESESVVWDLKVIADTMVSSGYGKECVSIYKMVRKSIIDENMHYLGVEKLSLSQVQKMDWEVVEVKIKTWLLALKTAITTLFHGEKILCEKVFCVSPLTAELCFSEIAKEGAESLFRFPEHVAKYKKLSPEKLFRILDLYDLVSELSPEIQSIFSYDSISSVRSQAANCLIRLGDVVQKLLMDFEAAIHNDNSKSSVSNGGVHPLTRYVVNFLIFISDYSGILTNILSDFPNTPQSPLPESYFSSPVPEDHPISLISERLAYLVLVLLCKLDIKARMYNDVALCYLFLANNLNYVVSKIGECNLKLLLGDHWLLMHERKVKQYALNYEQLGWSRAISSLPSPTKDISLDKVFRLLQNFNASFDEAFQKQSSWVVPDEKLRNEIQISIAKKLVLPYQESYEIYQVLLRTDSGPKSVVRSPDDLGNYLSDLFYGNATSSRHKK